MTQPRTVLIAITRDGVRHARALKAAWPEAQLAIPPRWRLEGEDAHLLHRPLREELGPLFQNNQRLVLFLAVGAVVRLIAPWLGSKLTDPAVVVVDSAARYAIALLSGHLGGGNQLAREVASLLGAEAVITTASEALGVLAVDLLGQELDWELIATPEALRFAAACVVNGDPVAILQEAGSRAWRDDYPQLPPNITLLNQPVGLERFRALLWISTRQELPTPFVGAVVHYRPPLGQEDGLVLAIGCDRNTSLATLETAVAMALEQHSLGSRAVRLVATIDLKGDEPALLALVAAQGWPLQLYSAAQLAEVVVPNPSETVRRHTGTPSVAEAAALLAAGGKRAQLVMEKTAYRGQDGRNVTIAAARLKMDDVNNYQ